MTYRGRNPFIANRRFEVSRLCVLIILAALATGPQSATATDYALLIGINDYDDKPVRQGVVELEYAVDDAIALKDILERSGYDVSVLDNNNARHEHILAEFARLRTQVQPDDTFLLFFAGHGLRDPSNGQTYWLTHDTDLDLLDRNGIRIGFLFDYVRDIKANRKVLLLDHCFSGDVIDDLAAGSQSLAGATGRNAGGASGRVEKKIDSVGRRGVFPTIQLDAKLKSEGRGVVVLAAAKDEAFEVASLGHGIFTAALIQALNTHRADQDGDGKLAMYELIDFVAGEDGEVAAIASRHNLQQLVDDIVETRNLSDWSLATLPLQGNEADTLAQSYVDKLESWRNRPDGDDWISVRVLAVSKDAINRWKETTSNGTTLGPKYQEIVESVGAHIGLVDDGDLQEKDIAKYFDEDILNVLETYSGVDAN